MFVLERLFSQRESGITTKKLNEIKHKKERKKTPNIRRMIELHENNQLSDQKQYTVESGVTDEPLKLYSYLESVHSLAFWVQIIHKKHDEE